MRRSRAVFTAVAFVIGVLAVVVENWLTAAAMVFVIIAQVIAERSARRRATHRDEPTSAE